MRRGHQDGDGLRELEKTKVLFKPALLQPPDSLRVPESDAGAQGRLSGLGQLCFYLHWEISLRFHGGEFSPVKENNLKGLHETK